MEYKQLATSFEGRASQKEFSFTQLRREGSIAIYEKKDKKSTLVYYETIVIQKHNGRIMPGGIKIEPSEFFPSDSMWGASGWTFQSLDKAEIKFNELIIK